MLRRIWTAILALCSIGGLASAQGTPQESGTLARLRGLSVVGPHVAWASGSDATCLRTTDGGATWARLPVPESSGLDFRDVQAIDADTAHLLSIGEGPRSRIYKTTDGGTSWTLTYLNRDPSGFLDALAFCDADHGLALGDPVEGRFTILATDVAGADWAPIPAGGMPAALPGDGAFAASGTCLVVGGDGNAWFATGGAEVARVFRSTDRGRSWSVHPTPIRAGTPSAGAFSLAFRDPEHGVLVGGDYRLPDESDRVAARTVDGGRTWEAVRVDGPRGFRSAVARVPGSSRPTLVAVGPNGTDLSEDGGVTWRRSGLLGFHAVGFALDGSGWAVGDEGLIARFSGPTPSKPSPLDHRPPGDVQP